LVVVTAVNMNKIKKFFKSHDLIELVLIYLPVNVMFFFFLYHIIKKLVYFT